jgi:hypothetical protein
MAEGFVRIDFIPDQLFQHGYFRKALLLLA